MQSLSQYTTKGTKAAAWTCLCGVCALKSSSFSLLHAEKGGSLVRWHNLIAPTYTATLSNTGTCSLVSCDRLHVHVPTVYQGLFSGGGDVATVIVSLYRMHISMPSIGGSGGMLPQENYNLLDCFCWLLRPHTQFGLLLARNIYPVTYCAHYIIMHNYANFQGGGHYVGGESHGSPSK